MVTAVGFSAPSQDTNLASSNLFICGSTHKKIAAGYPGSYLS